MRSHTTSDWLKGYTRTCNTAGYRPTSAPPWTEPDTLVALTFLASVVDKSAGLPLLLLLRDGFCMSVMWQTMSRGDNAVAWRLENIRLPTGGNCPRQNMTADKFLPTITSVTLSPYVPSVCGCVCVYVFVPFPPFLALSPYLDVHPLNFLRK
jgi:hypothetical protein